MFRGYHTGLCLSWLFLLVVVVGCSPGFQPALPDSCTTSADCPGSMVCQSNQCQLVQAIAESPNVSEGTSEEPNSTEAAGQDGTPDGSAEVGPEKVVTPEESQGQDEPAAPDVKEETVVPDTSEDVPEVSAEVAPESPADQAPACIDNDKDGYCKNILGPKGKLDCDDNDKQSFPGNPEVCDGKDNDCDGNIDNGLTPPKCTKQLGVCGGALKTCGGSKGWMDCSDADYTKHSSEYEAKETKCDNKDNDCDGSRDVGCACKTGDTRTCGTNQGECKAGTQSCSNGSWSTSCTGETKPKAEVCGDNKDNNCDGYVDEGCPCNYLNKSAGVCKTAKRDSKGVCSQPAGYSTTEACDGLDNDCDGLIDEAFAKKGQSCPVSGKLGECGKGTYTSCTGGKLVCTGPNPTTEICDGKDNDCDGSVDRVPGSGFRLQQWCSSSPNTVGVGICIGGYQLCQNGTYGACTQEQAPLSREICSNNGQDDNCNGSHVDSCSCDGGTLVHRDRFMTGHRSNIMSMAIAPNGTWFAVGSSDQVVKIWDTSGVLVSTIKTASSPFALAFSLDSKQIAISTPTYRVNVHDTSTGKLIRSIYDFSGYNYDLVFVSKNVLAGVSSKYIRTFDVTNGQALRTASLTQATRLAYSPTAKQFMVGTDSIAYLMDGADFSTKFKIQGHTSTITSVAFSQDGKWVATGSKDKTVNIRYANSGKLLKTLKGATDTLADLDFSPDGKWLVAACEDNNVYVWEVGSSLTSPSLTLEDHSRKVLRARFMKDSDTIVSVGDFGELRVWQVSQQKLTLSVPTRFSGVINAAVFSDSGEFMVAADSQGEIWFWNYLERSRINTRKYSTAMLAATYLFKNSFDFFATGGVDGAIRLWSQAGALVHTRSKAHVGQTVNSLAYMAKGSYLISGGTDGKINLWRVASSTKPTTPTSPTLSYSSHSGTVSSVAVVPGASIFVSGGSDQVVRVFNPVSSTSRPIQTFTGHSGWVYSVATTTYKNVNYAASGSADKTIKIWNLDTGKLYATLSQGGVVHDVAFDRTGAYLYANSITDRFLKIWSVATGKLIATLPTATRYFALPHPKLDELLTGSRDVEVYTCP